MMMVVSVKPVCHAVGKVKPVGGMSHVCESVTSCPCGRLSSEPHLQSYVASGSNGLKLIIDDPFVSLLDDRLVY